MKNLKEELIKLAYKNPELRDHLLPLIKTSSLKDLKKEIKDLHKFLGDLEPVISSPSHSDYIQDEGDRDEAVHFLGNVFDSLTLAETHILNIERGYQAEDRKKRLHRSLEVSIKDLDRLLTLMPSQKRILSQAKKKFQSLLKDVEQIQIPE